MTIQGVQLPLPIFAIYGFRLPFSHQEFFTMPTYECTFKMNEGDQGFTETYYKDAGSIDAIKADTDFWVQLRAACSHVDVLIKSVEVRTQPTAPLNAPSPRIAREYSYDTPGTQGGGGHIDEGPDITGVTAYYLSYCTNNRSRKISIRGLPDLQTIRRSGTGKSVPGPVLLPALNAFLANLRLASWQCRFQLPDSTAGYEPHLIKGLAPDPDNRSRMFVTTNEPPVVVKGDFVTFRRINKKITPYLKGFWEVIGAGNLGFVIAYRPIFDLDPKPEKMQYRKLGWQYQTFASFQFKSFTIRKTGRPSSPSRGKQSGVSLRR